MLVLSKQSWEDVLMIYPEYRVIIYEEYLRNALQDLGNVKMSVKQW